MRLGLIPADYFRGLALLLVHARGGHDAYLLGQWSETGWWYYYPLAILWKTPVALLLLTALAAACGRRWIPLLGAGVFLGLAMLNRADIGVRHILPVFPLLSVLIGAQLATRARVAAWLLCGWLLVVAVRARPGYLAYFNEIVGGSARGQRYLIDSNLDWGQDVKRLKTYVDQKGIRQLSGSYFGPGGALTYYGVPFSGATAAELASQHDVWLAVSVNWLMRPEYSWLRENHRAVDRVGDSIVIYRLP